MKRLVLFCMATVLLLAGCSAKNPAAPAETPVAIADLTETAAPDASAGAMPEATAAGSVQAPGAGLTTEKKIQAMLPVLDSIVRTMGVEGEGQYAPEDPVFFWTVLYLAGENWGGLHPRVQTAGDEVIVPRAVMEEYASAAFAAYTQLPPIPETLAQSLRYDETQDAYLLTPSDMGEADTELSFYTVETDGAVTAIVSLYSAEDALGGLRFRLAENAHAGALAEPVFFYSVESAANESGHSAFWQEYASGETVDADLNCDGAAERITVSATGDDRASVEIQYGDQRYTEAFEYLYNVRWHLGDALGSDNATELYICGDTGSVDYETYIYRLTPEGVKKDVLYGTVLYADGSGLLPLETAINVLGTYGGVGMYQLGADGAFTLASDYGIYQSDEAWTYRALTVKKDGLPVTGMPDGEKTTLPAGTQMVLLRTDAESYGLCQLQDGSLCRVDVTHQPDDWQFFIDGLPESEWFTELLYAG